MLAIRLEGASNLRDLGGWPTESGGRVSKGRIFRSASLGAVTPADIRVLGELGLRTICDFRGRQERLSAPTPFDGIIIHSLPIEPTIGASLRDILARRAATGEDLLGLLRQAYEGYALSATQQYRTLFTVLQQREALAVLFHCSAGKDRTGFAAALVLRTLGVAWDAVIQDYLATNHMWRGDSALSRELPMPLRNTLLRAHPELLEAAFAAIDRQYGSFDAYLAQALGVDQAARARLQAMLLE